MDVYLSLLLHSTVALITIINPIAAASIMVSMVGDEENSAIKVYAIKATLTLFISSLIALFGGEIIFKLFGINVLSLKVIGGVILMLIAINMAHGHQSKARHSKEEQVEAAEKEDISIVPIGIPILFGPGVIATIVVLNNEVSELHSKLIGDAIIATAILLSSVVAYLALRYSGTINRVLGVTGMKILTRVMGLIVGAIAAQFLVSGIKGLWNIM